MSEIVIHSGIRAACFEFRDNFGDLASNRHGWQNDSDWSVIVLNYYFKSLLHFREDRM